MPNNHHEPTSGTQFILESGDYRAVVASVGATLRTLTHAGRNLVVPFDADQVRPAYRGANLVPWPNRIANGSYGFNGRTEQLPINEVDRMTALHGLVLWNKWELREKTPECVRLGAVIEPQAGYPHRLDLEAAYTLSPQGLHWRITAVNVGTGPDTPPAPYGVGPHPYLVAGAGTVDAWTMELPAAQVLQVTPDRLLPTTLAGVDMYDGGAFDFQRPRTVGATSIDHAFTSIAARGQDGVSSDGTSPVKMAEVRLLAPEGTGVLMRWDPLTLPWVQIHTADRPDAPELSRIGMAVEPMSCPPDAFNSGQDLIILPLHGRHEASWTITAL